MGFKPKRNRRRFRRVPRKKSYARRLKDKKINTVVEVRMKEIAAKEAAKNVVKLIVRDYQFGAYAEATNKFTPGLINHTGARHECSRILKATTLVDLNSNGYRLGNQCKILGFKLKLRASLEENNSLAYLEHSVLSWRLIRIMADWDQGAAAPDVQECMPWFPFGYDSKIDTDIKPEQLDRKIRVLMKGSISFRSTETRASVTTKSYFKKLSRPLIINYNSDDLDGQSAPIDYKFYLVCRSNVPDLTADNAMFPGVVACLKTYYVDA